MISQVEKLPIGIVNIFTGGQEAGNALVVSPDIPVISFTGNTKTGCDISVNAAPQIKRPGLELSGKTSMIVVDDADIVAAILKLVDDLTVFAG